MSKVWTKLQKVPVFICFIVLLLIASLIGFAISKRQLDKQIKSLEAQRDDLQVTYNTLLMQEDLTDIYYANDKAFLDRMFDDIFTFYDENGFYGAREQAKAYGLPEGFIDLFYDTTELTGAFTNMLDIICQYNSSDLYLLDRQDGIGYYVAIVDLDMVKYQESIQIGIFIALSEDDNSDFGRVKSMIYYEMM